MMGWVYTAPFFSDMQCRRQHVCERTRHEIMSCEPVRATLYGTPHLATIELATFNV